MLAMEKQSSGTSQESSADSCLSRALNLGAKVHENGNVMPKGDDDEPIRGRKRRCSFDSQSPDISFDEKLWTTSQDTLSELETETESESNTTSTCADKKTQPKHRLLVGLCSECNSSLEPLRGV
jgi:hypothetical protein